MNAYLQQLVQKVPEHRAHSGSNVRQEGILTHWRLILGIAVAIALLGTLHALSTRPIYQANMLIQIKRSMPVGADLQVEVPASTEVEILRSRSILAGVVDALGLEISVEPKRFPLLGAFLSRGKAELSKPGLFGRGGYAWGGEQATVARFEVPDALLGKPFTLRAAGQGSFQLAEADSGIAFSGKVGQFSRATTPYGDIGILVTDLHAQPGAQFIVSRTPRFQVIDRLQRSLVISENGKQSNVIGLSLKGSDPEQISGILNAIGSEYLRQHASEKSGETGDVLAFYNRQLEESKARLQNLDARFARLNGMHGTSDPGEELQILSQQSVALQDKLADAENSKSELSSRYLPAHPAMLVAEERIRNIQRELNRVQAKRRTLASVEQQMASLTRDKQITAELNASLLGVRQKLDALALPGRTDVRLVDRAEIPYQPVGLGVRARIALACVLGLAAGLVAAILRNAFVSTRRRPPFPRYDGQFRLV